VAEATLLQKGDLRR